MSMAQAEFVQPELTSNDHDTVIEPTYFEQISQEEPIFTSPNQTRDLASFEEAQYRTPSELQGRLSVVKEIPYSYAWVSHKTMRRRVLAEIEREEAENKNAR